MLVPVETQSPGMSQRLSQEVFLVLGFEVMGQVHCTERATGHVGDVTAPFVRDGSRSWGCGQEGQ